MCSSLRKNSIEGWNDPLSLFFNLSKLHRKGIRKATTSENGYFCCLQYRIANPPEVTALPLQNRSMSECSSFDEDKYHV